jgi:maltose alpha-D-glucosyltransferase/alpha-amylase
MDAKFYELYVDKFAVDFRGLIGKLDYFDHLGVNALHILPFYPSPMVDDGYDISDYEGIRPELGTLDDFSELTSKAHARGIHIIIDLILNHVSESHPWFVEARASKDSPKRDWFLWSETGREFALATNSFPDFKSSNWIWNEATHDYYHATFYPQQPDLNWDNEELFSAMLRVADTWVRRGADGFRLDAVPRLIKREGGESVALPETHNVVRRLRAHLEKEHGGGIALLAEVAEQPALARAFFGDGDECQLVYMFPLAPQIFLTLARGDDSAARQMVADARQLPANCAWAIFLRNHDELNTADLSDGDRVALLDSIDPGRDYPFRKGLDASVRVATALRGNEENINRAFRLLYSLPGIPIMYFGDEIGMKNLPLENGFVDTRRYVRGSFDWRDAERQMRKPGSLLNMTARTIRESYSQV